MNKIDQDLIWGEMIEGGSPLSFFLEMSSVLKGNKTTA